MLSRPTTQQARAELAQALEGLARISRDGIPGCADASVTVLHDGEARTMSATDLRAVAVDEQQYQDGSGPCLSAIGEQERVSVPDFDHESRWPQGTAEGRRVGIHSSLSVPLEGDGQVLGALNLYGAAAGAFGQDSHRAADAFAQQAVVILRFLNQLDVERAQHAQERAVAAELQRSLLPTLPDLDGIDAAARYLVSGSAAQVGGDWYDLFALPDGAIGEPGWEPDGARSIRTAPVEANRRPGLLGFRRTPADKIGDEPAPTDPEGPSCPLRARSNGWA